MKICSMHIDGFGKWQNYDLTDLSHLQFIYGENEAGKSTIIAFIHSILFGFPSTKGQRKSFEPRAGTAYGGFLMLEHPTEGKIKVERLKKAGVQQLTVFFEDGREAGEEVLTHLLNGMSQQQYLAIFSFDLFGIQGVHQISEEDLNRYFLAIGVTGSDAYLQVADDFLKKGEQLYKPKGRNPELNQQAVQLKKMKQQLQVGKEKNEQYMLLLKQKLERVQKIKALQSQLQQLNQHLLEMKDLTAFWELYQEYVQLKETLALSAPFLIDAADSANYQDYQQQQQNIRIQLKHLKEQEIALSGKFTEKYEMEQSHMALLQSKVEEWPVINQKQEEIREAHKKLEHVEQKMIKQAYEADLNVQQSANVLLKEDLLKQIREMNSQVKNYQQQYEILLLKQQQNIEKRLFVQAQITQLASLEQQLEKNEIAPKLRTIENKRSQSKHLMSKGRAYTALGLSFVLSLLVWVTLSGTVQYLAFFLLISMAAVSLFPLFTFKKEATEMFKHPTLNREYYQQHLAEHERYQGLTAQLDALKAEEEQLASQILQRTQQTAEIEQTFSQLKSSLFLPKELVNDRLEEKVKILMQLKKFALEQATIKAQIQKNEKLVNKWINQCEVLTESLALDWSQPTASIEKLRYLLERQKEAKFSMVGKNRQQEQILRQKKDLEAKQQQLTQLTLNLFAKGNIQNEAAFLEEQKRLRLKEEQTSRYQLLTKQLQTRLSLLAKYQSLEMIEQKIALIEAEINQSNHLLNHQLSEKAQLNLDLQQLEEGKQYAQLLQQYGNQKEQFKEQATVWLSYQVANYMIERTLAYVQQDQLPKTLRVAEQLLEKLTNGRYQKIIFKENRLMIQDDLSHDWRAVDLSQGTSEQLYLALRLAFMIHFNQMLQLPIIIDDAFVHFDQQRKAAAFDLLKELSQDYQIFYFSCQKENHFFFDKEQQII